VRVPLEAKDADGDPLAIDLVDGPAGARIEGDAIVWPRPLARRHLFTVQASDGLPDSLAALCARLLSAWRRLASAE
jgi:hypothetical protein